MLNSGPFPVEAGEWRMRGRGKTSQRRATGPWEEGVRQRESQSLGTGGLEETPKLRRVGTQGQAGRAWGRKGARRPLCFCR